MITIFKNFYQTPKASVSQSLSPVQGVRDKNAASNRKGVQKIEHIILHMIEAGFSGFIE